MKKFKFLSIAIIVSFALVVLGILLSEHAVNTGPKIPDEGLEFLIVIPIVILALILGLALDLFFLFTRSKKPLIQKRKPFWQVMGILVILGLFYWIFVQAST